MALVAPMSKADVEGRLLFSQSGVSEPIEITATPFSAARFFKVPTHVVTDWRNKEDRSSAQITLSIRSILIKQVEVLADGNIAVTLVPQYFESRLFDPAPTKEVTRHLIVANDHSLRLFLADFFAPNELKALVREIFKARLSRTQCDSLLI